MFLCKNSWCWWSNQETLLEELILQSSCKTLTTVWQCNPFKKPSQSWLKHCDGKGHSFYFKGSIAVLSSLYTADSNPSTWKLKDIGTCADVAIAWHLDLKSMIIDSVDGMTQRIIHCQVFFISWVRINLILILYKRLKSSK